VSQILECAGTVRAWTGYCYPTETTGEEQSVGRGAATPPAPRPAVVPGSGKQKKSKGAVVVPVPLVAGDKRGRFLFKPHDITEARFLPRLLGRPFSLQELETRGVALDAKTLGTLRSWVAASDVASGANAGLAMDGYLQLKVRQPSGEAEWVPAWGVVSGGLGLTPMREDTSHVYVLPDELAEAMRALVTEANASWTP
jgi:hypothetical protein